MKVGRPLHKVVKKPSKLKELRQIFGHEKFFLFCDGNKWIDLVLEHSATGEDALKGWLIAAYAAEIEKSSDEMANPAILNAAFAKTENVFPEFLSHVKTQGWHTDRFLDGTGSRFAYCSGLSE